MDTSMNYSGEKRILIVDDEPAVRNLLARRLGMHGFACDTEPDGLRAIHRVKEAKYDLVILDVNMPYLDGTEMLPFLRKAIPDVPVVMISGMDGLDVVRKTLREGAYDYLVKPLDFDELEVSIRRALQHGHLSQTINQYQRDLENQVAERTRELGVALEQINKTYDATILALGSALETRDIETQTHGIRVAHFSYLLASSLGIADQSTLTIIQRGAYLHDIGKIGVPDAILRKPQSLSNDEWQIMRKHPQIGKDIIEGIDFLVGTIPLVYCHHEQYDGQGYPQGLAGDLIPIEARIFSVADALDAMITDRPYRQAMTISQAKNEIISHSGRQFDPKVAESLVKLDDEMLIVDSPSLFNGSGLALVAAS
ncbi:MAG: response regulator [Spirochaetales bacterium]|nr:response regulator [Spirochaetales bacterium]